MPQQRHHRRHHTWPHCGSELCMRQPHNLDIHVSKPDAGPARYIAPSFQTAASVRQNELLCDDMGMPELTRQPKRVSRLWFRSNKARTGTDQIALSGSTGQTRIAYWGVLRRLTRRPPMIKSRSLVGVPSVTGSGRNYVATGSGWVMLQGIKQDFVGGSGGDRLAGEVVDAARIPSVLSERRHRRRHSEQPRAWREPSAALWTVKEHEE
ncbi:uncharacterized protein N7515_005933 [Penicillium bovifimosum]|uniref:Uncharacterized protein n=1 Tax=Penicillium bovifimosum TaxID=126998 RepID=A0A9W9GVD4_9EURO|nr:uncharacterized protein N7515_005933 [Penicillium bovifimosum]KAJ5129894.1 hypothetical protein N7515_005933 [Penicillium bovifimosum]